MGNDRHSVWKTVELGGRYTNGEKFCGFFSATGIRVDHATQGMLMSRAFIVSDIKRPIKLVDISVAELGLSDGARYDEICANGLNRGLVLCPSEVGPVVRMEYSAQPSPSCHLIAMQPLHGPDGRLRIFTIVNGEEAQELNSTFAAPEANFWRAENRFIFALSN